MYSIGITETLNMFCDQLCIQSCFLDTPPPNFYVFDSNVYVPASVKLFYIN